MKKKIYLHILLLFSAFWSAQVNPSPNENYSYTKSCLTEDCSKKSESITYYDGLARPKQAISIGSTPSGKDIVSHIGYDDTGIHLKSYMPIPQAVSQNGTLYDNPLDNASANYGAEKIYSENVMEDFPQNRVMQSYGTGNAWVGKSASFAYQTNLQNDVVKYTVSTTWSGNTTLPSLYYSGYYAAGILNKNAATDPDNNTTTEFKNGKGQTLLVRKSSVTGEQTDTYYIYDEYDNLAYVLSPLASKANENLTAGSLVPTATLTNLCYQYRYDTKFRTVEKKLPGKGWEYVVYDKQDRVVLSQDANMRSQGKWLFTKYDKLGRVLYTGITEGSGRQDEQTNVYAKGLNNEERTASVSFTTSEMPVYYTNVTAYPTSFQQILSVSYYDTYPEGTPQVSAQILNQDVLAQDPTNSLISTKGLATASYIKNMEDDNWTKNYIWYDTKGRTIGTHTVNHLRGSTKTEIKLDFAGVSQQTKVYHRRLAGDAEKVITQNFEYDSKNRLKKQWHQVDGNAQELLAENTYNELSQLTNKKVGNNLQSIDYTYDIRGSLKKLNDPSNLNGKLFAYEMKNTAPVNTTAKYNGTITEVDWKTSADNVLRRYSYQYDGLSRLKKGIYSEPDASIPQNGFYNETIGYDINSNITSLQRNGKNALGAAGVIDNLSYNYTGNRLNSVTENATDYAGYPDVSGNLISYDNNGNMTDHKDKGILQIDYNILDLPNYVKFDKTYVPRSAFEGEFNVNTKYVYRADGAKIKKIYTYGSASTNNEQNIITEYMDGFQYETTDSWGKPTQSLPLKFVPTSEGYYNFEKNQYIYSYTDHLGNIRVSYSKNANGSAEVLEENNFYPFGMKHEGYNQTSGNPSYNYGYSGKEFQKETDWSDFGARMYMSDIGRWGVIDPLAETSRRFTPYNYAYNNPVMFIDPDGRKARAVGSYEPPDFYTGSPMTDLVRGGVATRDELYDRIEQMEMDSQVEGNIASFTDNGVSYDKAVELSQNGAISFNDFVSSGDYFQGIDFSQFGSGLNQGKDDTDKAVKYKKEYEFNKNVQMAETILSEALFETTQYGQILQYSRKALVKVYGNHDEKAINSVYSILVNKLDFYKKSLSKADNPVYTTIVAGIVTTLGANTLRLEVKNEYLLYQIKRLDMNVYKMIFPDNSKTLFGGGGANGKW